MCTCIVSYQRIKLGHEVNFKVLLWNIFQTENLYYIPEKVWNLKILYNEL